MFKIKNDNLGNSSKYKARLVAKGFQEKYGIDYYDTYAPIAKLTTIRVVLAVGIKKQFHFHQLDVKTAFLHGDLSEEIFMAIPQVFIWTETSGEMLE